MSDYIKILLAIAAVALAYLLIGEDDCRQYRLPQHIEQCRNKAQP